jgi:hypothetical protein
VKIEAKAMPIGSGRTTPLNENDRIDFERDVFNIFVEPSIQDWAAARLLFQANLFRQFAWSCAQALEKSIKAALLLNWESAKFGHDFSAKFSKLNELSSGLMPSNFPEDYPSFEWMVEHFQNIENCSETISRFERNGSTESRYASTDLLIRPDDLFRLDFLMKHILRHCRELDEMSVDWLKKNPNEIHAFLAYAVNRLESGPINLLERRRAA